MAAWRSTIERNTPRLSRRRVSLENKVSTALSQEHDFGVKWKTKRGCRASQAFHLGMLVGGIVVEDDVNDLADRRLGLDGVEEADELLMAVPLHAAADDIALDDVEGGEQGGRTMPLVVMGHRAGAPFLDRQPGLGAVERLDLMGWMAPSLHRRAMLVAVEGHRSEEPF